MRHRKKGRKLSRKSPHRKKTLMALSTALIENKRIVTTVSKAKELRPYVEPVITRAKEDTQHNRRQAFRYLQDKEAVTELFEDVSEKVNGRPGGYTRIIRLGRRKGDGAEMAMVELVDYNDVPPQDGGGSGGGGTRRGSGGGQRSIKAAKREEEAGEAATAPAESEDAPAEDTARADEPAGEDDATSEATAGEAETTERPPEEVMEEVEEELADEDETAAEAETDVDAEAEADADVVEDQEEIEGDEEDEKNREE